MVIALFSSILRSALISSIGICIILFLKKNLFKEYTKGFNYYIWLIVIIRMTLPFEVPIYINSNLMINKLSSLSTSNLDTASKTSDTLTSLSSSLNANEVIENVKHFNINIFEILSYLWLITSLIIIAYRAFSYLKLKMTLTDLSVHVNDEKIKAIYNELLIELEI